jgi:hypothetical protein
MREYDDQVRPAVVLRRIIIVVMVLTAVPVALWTVTAFVRTYVGPPKLPAFRQLATNVTEQQESTGATRAAGDESLWQTVTTFVRAHAAAPQIPSVGQLTATFTGNSNARPQASGGTPAAAEQVRPSAPSPMTVEARATATDARDTPASSKEPSANDANMPVSPTKVTDASPVSMTPKSADMPVALPANARVTDISQSSRKPEAAAPNAWPPPPQQNATPQTNPPWPPAPQPSVTLVSAMQPSAAQPSLQPNGAEQTAAAAEPPADAALPAGQPLTGRIPLPRRRPSDLAMVQITAANVPMPRPRPDVVSSVAPSETATSAGPLNFLNNLFH